MINSRKIDDLKPEVAVLCRAFVQQCHLAGIEVLITSTYRDVEAQDAIYNQGRTTPGRIITNCKGGNSMHNYRVAFDWVPLDVKGAPVWNDSHLWRECGQIAQDVGLEWGGAWANFVDMPHCQYTQGKSIADLHAEYNLLARENIIKNTSIGT